MNEVQPDLYRSKEKKPYKKKNKKKMQYAGL